MDSAEQAAGPSDLTNLSHRGLIERYCGNRKDKNVADELWRRCSEILLQSLRKLVLSRNGLCPDSCDRKTFLDSTFSRAYINLFRRICRFKNLDSPQSLGAWLSKVARSTALDEYRYLERTRADIVELGLGEISPDDAPAESGQSMGEEGESRPFRTKLLSFYGNAQKIPPPDAGIKVEERKFVVRELLVRYTTVSDENADSAQLIRLRHFSEWQVAKIADYIYGVPADARQEKTWERYVFREMAHDYENLRVLLSSEFGIRDLQQV